MEFFQKRRQNILLTCKTIKYLKYAIGKSYWLLLEFSSLRKWINWNESKKEETVELLYLKNIVSDSNNQLISIDEQIEEELEDSKDLLENYH